MLHFVIDIHFINLCNMIVYVRNITKIGSQLVLLQDFGPRVAPQQTGKLFRQIDVHKTQY